MKGSAGRKASPDESGAKEKGTVLPLAAIAIVFLIGSVAFAVDLGWIYFNGKEAQKAADAAALAGVIFMPSDFDPEAKAAALQLAQENGYTDASLGGGATVLPEQVPTNTRQLKVTVTKDVDTFFLRVFGWDKFTVTRDATAERVLPLPMGSPINMFGNDPTSGFSPNFWANIHGRWTDTIMGDKYSSACRRGSGTSNCPNEVNPSHRPEGYIYGVEVPSGATNLRVQAFDGPFSQNPTNDPSCDNDPAPGPWGDDHCYTGDHNTCGGCGGPGPTVRFTLYEPSITPLILDPADIVCNAVWSPQSTANRMQWAQICPTVGSPDEGVYRLQVRINNSEVGLNRFSLRAFTDGAAGDPRLYGLGDMSIFANFQGTTATFYLAEVEEVHAGKDLLIELYDPGDASGNNFVSVIDPTGSIPPCRYEVTRWQNGAIEESGSPGSCTINMTRPAHDFNGDSIIIIIPLPANYSCDSQPFPAGNGCWWRLFYSYQGGVQDTTTWSARVTGDPIRLVE